MSSDEGGEVPEVPVQEVDSEVDTDSGLNSASSSHGADASSEASSSDKSSESSIEEEEEEKEGPVCVADQIEDVKKYFSQDEWAEMPLIDKLSCKTQLDIYRDQLAKGQACECPYFMARFLEQGK